MKTIVLWLVAATSFSAAATDDFIAQASGKHGAFGEKAAPLVKDARTASEATQILNRDFFKLINTHYHPKRLRTNQSPKESIEQDKATCTWLAIILIAASQLRHADYYCWVFVHKPDWQT